MTDQQKHNTMQGRPTHHWVGMAAVFAYKKSFNRLYYLRRAVYAGLTVLILVVSFAIQAIGPTIAGAQYNLEPTAIKLLGDSREDTAQYLKLDTKNQQYSFEVPAADGSKGASKHSGRIDNIYSTNLAVDPKQGITYTDTANKIDITVTPNFVTGNAKKIDGDHIIYPAGPNKLAYTLKYNGLKEDIIVPEFGGDQLGYSFELSLPSGVEARLDTDGNIGIYSADSSLYGNIQFGSDEDRAKIDKARENSKKTNLIATIPSPIVKDANGKEYGDKATFKLSDKTIKKTAQKTKDVPAVVAEQLASQTTKNNYTLDISAHDLRQLSYPISIDPTIQAKNTSDFSTGNFDGGVDMDVSNSLIKRIATTGGELGSWTTDNTTSPNTGYGTTALIYNGYMYILRSTYNVWYAPIDPNTGDIGTFIDSGVAPPGGFAQNHPVTLYNGYIYVSSTEGTTGDNNVQYSKINANGTLNAFVTTTSFTTARGRHSLIAYNGYLYITGGYYQTGCPLSCVDHYLSDTQYSKVNADGSIGAWAATGGSLPTARKDHNAIAYNGYYYIFGGIDTSGNGSVLTHYNKINADGTLNSWVATTSVITSRNGAASLVVGGYIYSISGSSTATSIYAPINADGSVGTWRFTTSISSARGGATAAYYNGYLYIVGGSNSPTEYGDIQYARVYPAGRTTSYTTSANTFTGRGWTTSVYTNGYLYVLGGCAVSDTPASCSTPLSTVEAAPVNDDGTVGTWSAKTSMPGPRWAHASVAANGVIYVNGGCTASLGTCVLQGNTYYARVGNTGDLTWFTDGNALNTPRREHTLTMAGKYLYAIAGYAGGNISSVEKAQVGSGGGFGAFTAEASLPQARNRLSSVTYGNQIYVVGGGGNNIYRAQIGAAGALTWSPTGTFNVFGNDVGSVVVNGYLYAFRGTGVDYAPINADGSLGTVVSNTALSVNRYPAGVAAAKGNIYLVGGCGSISSSTCNSLLNTVSTAPFNNGGSGFINGWTATTAMTDPDGGALGANETAARQAPGVIAIDSCIFVIGGFNGSVNFKSVQSAAINANGTLTAWVKQADLPFTAANFGFAGYNGHLYIQNNANIYYNTYTASTCSSGGWTLAPVLNTTRAYGSLAAANGFLYALGGQNGAVANTSAEYSVIGANGVPGAWTLTSSTNARHSFGTAQAYGGYIYLLTGCYIPSSGSVCVDANDSPTSVESAQVLSNGALSSWTSQEGLSYGSIAGGSFIYNGYIYYMGGNNNNSAVSVPTSTYAQYAELGPNGTVSHWQRTNFRSSGGANFGFTAYNNYFYLLGGVDSGSGATQATVDYTSAQTIARSGTYSKLMNFEKGVRPTEVITRGNKLPGSRVAVLYSNNNNTNNLFGSNVSATNIGYTGASPTPLSLGTNITLAQYLWLSYTIDDTQSAVFPDSTGGQTGVADYDVYYTAAPSARLKGGKTFTGGQNRGLDAP